MSKKKRLPYRHEDGTSLIEIRLHKVQQLFSSLDPAPFRERDLDQAAESYIIYGIKDFPLSRPMKIVLHLPEPELAVPDIASVPDAVRNYFAYREIITKDELKTLLHNGWITMLIALVFMASCLLARQMIEAAFVGTAADIVMEGLQIMSWVALWRPINIFLYEWWPMLKRIHIYAKLKAIDVELRALAP